MRPPPHHRGESGERKRGRSREKGDKRGGVAGRVVVCVGGVTVLGLGIGECGGGSCGCVWIRVVVW
eukprot:11958148-Alexandrium_andersonii.AAC.1